MLYVGTSYFPSLETAIRYYRDYSEDRQSVTRKLELGEIHIGQPPRKLGDKLLLIDAGTRWAIMKGRPE